MSSLLRVSLRSSVGRSNKVSCSSAAKIHTSQPLDPTNHTPQPSIDEIAAPKASTSSAALNETDLSADLCVHVKLSYLHPSTKPRPPAPRAADLATGRIRPIPQYVPLSRHVFGTTPRRDILHSSVVYYLDSLRNGTASTKTRGEVNFSGRKIRPQKGTGNARLGTRGNPLLRKGGVIHGPKPRDMSSKLPRRVRELALRSALSARWQGGDLHVVSCLTWDAPPQTTGKLRKLLGCKQWSDVLFLTAPRNPSPSLRSLEKDARPSAADPVYTQEQKDEHTIQIANFVSALGNIPQTDLIELQALTEEQQEEARNAEEGKKPGELHAYEVLKRKRLVLDLGAVEWLEEKLGGAIFQEEETARDLEEKLTLTEGATQEGTAEEMSEEEEEIDEEAQKIVDDALQEPPQPKKGLK